MNSLISQLQIRVNEKIYLKDPNSSELGRKIIAKGIDLVDEIGLESFTFRKLARELDTTESSIYRYFENKHKFLLYLMSWYWGWLEYQLVFATSNIQNPEHKLLLAIQILCDEVKSDEKIGEIKLQILTRVIISESSKAYFTKGVDAANREGFYSGYKRLVNRVAEIALEINPEYKFTHTLVSTLFEGINHQKYFAEHLPSLTEAGDNPKDLAAFYFDLALSTLKIEQA